MFSYMFEWVVPSKQVHYSYRKCFDFIVYSKCEINDFNMQQKKS